MAQFPIKHCRSRGESCAFRGDRIPVVHWRAARSSWRAGRQIFRHRVLRRRSVVFSNVILGSGGGGCAYHFI